MIYQTIQADPPWYITRATYYLIRTVIKKWLTGLPGTRHLDNLPYRFSWKCIKELNMTVDASERCIMIHAGLTSLWSTVTDNSPQDINITLYPAQIVYYIASPVALDRTHDIVSNDQTWHSRYYKAVFKFLDDLHIQDEPTLYPIYRIVFK